MTVSDTESDADVKSSLRQHSQEEYTKYNVDNTTFNRNLQEFIRISKVNNTVLTTLKQDTIKIVKGIQSNTFNKQIKTIFTSNNTASDIHIYFICNKYLITNSDDTLLK